MHNKIITTDKNNVLFDILLASNAHSSFPVCFIFVVVLLVNRCEVKERHREREKAVAIELKENNLCVRKLLTLAYHMFFINIIIVHWNAKAYISPISRCIGL